MTRRQCVLSRPLYRYNLFNLQSVPPAQRHNALALQIRQWSPYAQTGQAIAWSGDQAMVWLWDEERLQELLISSGINPAKIRMIPETLLRPPVTSGLRLVATLDGLEGQHWQNQRLVHSRWWATTPTETEWAAFQRDTGISPEQQTATPPTPLSTPLLKHPWTPYGNAAQSGAQGSLLEKIAVTAGVIALSLPTLWQGVQLIKLRQATTAAHIQKRDIDQTAQPILQARGNALEALARIETLRALNPYPDQLTLMAAIARDLPSKNTQLLEWKYENGKLRILMGASHTLTSGDVVKAYQTSGLFDEVRTTASSQSDRLELAMDVTPQ